MNINEDLDFVANIYVYTYVLYINTCIVYLHIYITPQNDHEGQIKHFNK